MKKIYERNINSNVHELGANRILTEASLLDINHNMHVELEINTKTRVIEKARAFIQKAPLKVCDTTTDLMQKLEGQKIERGINRVLLSALGHADGCTHLYELALNAVRLSYNVMIGMHFNWKEWLSKSIDDETFVEAAKPYLKNACRPFRENKE